MLQRLVIASLLLALFAFSPSWANETAVEQQASAPTDYLTIVPPSDPAVAAVVEVQAPLLLQGSAEEKQQALRALLQLNDEAVLPYLARGLGEHVQDVKIGRFIVTGILQSFPSQALPLFQQLLARGDLAQRKAAAYGIGYLDDSVQSSLLLPLIVNPEESLRVAAVTGLATPANLAQELLLGHVLRRMAPEIEPHPVPEKLMAKVVDIGDKVAAEIEARDLSIPKEVFRIVRDSGDHEIARALARHYTKLLPPEQKSLGETLERLQEVNRRWLGRPVAIAAAEVEYDLWMRNLMGGDEKTFPISFDAQSLDLLRGRRIHLDRAIPLNLMLDELMTYPQLCQPRIEEATPERLSLRYRVPLGAEARIAIGTIHMSFWNGLTSGAAEARVEVDPKRNVPLAETVYNLEGKVLARFRFDEYVDAGDGALVPSKIEAELERAGAKQMRYSMEFQIVNGVWLFKNGAIFELVEGEAVERARGALRNVKVTLKGAASAA